jgi:hypothetical protein
MSRPRLMRALAGRGDVPAVAPLLQAHAARLEQVPAAAVLENAELLARSQRNAQALHSTDAIMLGDRSWLACAAWLCSERSLSVSAARRAVEERRWLQGRPPAEDLGKSEVAHVVLDALTRLRPVVGERAGLGVVIPDASLLCRQLAIDDASWAADAVLSVVREIGQVEPDLISLVGDVHEPPTELRAVAQFFGTELVHVCAVPQCTPGIVILDPDDPARWGSQQQPGTWLYTTAVDVNPDASPGSVTAAVAQLHSVPDEPDPSRG